MDGVKRRRKSGRGEGRRGDHRRLKLGLDK